MILKSLSLLLLVFLVFIFIFSSSAARRWRGGASTVPRARWKRIAGGVIAVAALTTAVIGTWKSVSAPLDASAGIVERPTRPGPVVKAPDESGYGIAEVEPCRIILRAYLLRPSQSGPSIVQGKSAVLDWPADRGFPQNLDLHWHGIDYLLSISVDEIWDSRGSGRLNGDQRLRVVTGSESSRSSSSMGGDIAYLGKGFPLTDDPVSTVKTHEPLSLWPQVSQELQIWLEAELVAKDDPLEQIAASEARLLPPAKRHTSRMVGQVFGFPPQPPGIALIAHWGPASLLIFLAAGAGAYAFRQSGLAFAGLLAAFVLIFGGLERGVVHHLASLAKDGQRPIAERQLAIQRLGDVFFHPAATSASLASLADDDSQPAELRQSARAMIHAFTVSARDARP